MARADLPQMSEKKLFLKDTSPGALNSTSARQWDQDHRRKTAMRNRSGKRPTAKVLPADFGRFMASGSFRTLIWRLKLALEKSKMASSRDAHLLTNDPHNFRDW